MPDNGSAVHFVRIGPKSDPGVRDKVSRRYLAPLVPA
jgi:hypothetical protein